MSEYGVLLWLLLLLLLLLYCVLRCHRGLRADDAEYLRIRIYASLEQKVAAPSPPVIPSRCFLCALPWPTPPLILFYFQPWPSSQPLRLRSLRPIQALTASAAQTLPIRSSSTSLVCRTTTTSPWMTRLWAW